MTNQHQGEGGSYVVGPDGVRTLVERTQGDGHREPADKRADKTAERVPPLPVNLESAPSGKRK